MDPVILKLRKTLLRIGAVTLLVVWFKSQVAWMLHQLDHANIALSTLYQPLMQGFTAVGAPGWMAEGLRALLVAGSYLFLPCILYGFIKKEAMPGRYALFWFFWAVQITRIL